VGSAELEISRLLNLQFNAPIVDVRRVFRDQKGVVLYMAEVTYRGDLIRLDMELKP
jgi:GntR family transcriptional regulator